MSDKEVDSTHKSTKNSTSQMIDSLLVPTHFGIVFLTDFIQIKPIFDLESQTWYWFFVLNYKIFTALFHEFKPPKIWPPTQKKKVVWLSFFSVMEWASKYIACHLKPII